MKLGKKFADLKVRPKLIVLHNIFFLVLTCAVYFALIPLFERTGTDPDVVHGARLVLFLVLGIVYVLAVILLEAVIMPRYVYQPLQLMLQADEATRQGDREHEYISDSVIPGDEIGQIMRSRNETVRQLRRHEDKLEAALARLEKAKQSLLEQDRLASLGLMSASVAHELNTPIAVLQGSIEKLMETIPNAQAQERLSRMLRVARRLHRISETLLDFASARTDDMGSVSIRPLVDEAWALLAIDEKASEVCFRNDVDSRHAVIGNADRLIQVFVNLLRNSLYAVHSSGHLTVWSREVEKDGATWIEMGFEDDGPGSPADLLPNIFEAFVSSRLDSRGTGLGLTVAEGIVTRHGGRIRAANREGGGAMLVVLLPSTST